MMPGVVRPGRRSFQLAGKGYSLVAQELLDGGKRSWSSQWASDQPAKAEPFEIELGNQSLGAGITFADAPGSYELADGLDFTPMGFTTWPKFADLQAVQTQAGTFRSKGVFIGGFLYVFRAGHVIKYDVTSSATWNVVSLHYLGTSNQYAGGGIAEFDGDLYVPVFNYGGSGYQVFQRLSTINTEVAEVQTITISGTPTGGTYTITFNDGFGAARTTAAIAYDATSATVQAALRLLAGLEFVTVAQSGSAPNYTHTVTLTAAPAAAGTSSPPQFTVTDNTTGGAHAITPATTTPGTADRWDLGPAAKEAQAFVTQLDGLWRGVNNVISKAITDPLTAGNWGAEYEVGDFGSGRLITDLAVYPGGDLIVGRSDGPWVVNPSYIGEAAIPELLPLVAEFNCMGMSYSQGYILIPHHLGIIRWRPGAWSMIGSEQDDLFEPSSAGGGFGALKGVVTWGKRTYILVDEASGTDQALTILSMTPGGRRAGGVDLQMHHLNAVSGVIVGGHLAGTIDANDGSSYLVCIYQTSTSAITGAVYSLGRGGLTPGLDPTVGKLSTSWQFKSSRLFQPNRRVQKTWLEVEGWADISTDGSTTVSVKASVDGGAAFDLLASPTGAAANLSATGRFRRYFPVTSGSVGKDVRLQFAAVTVGGTGASVRIRDVSVRGTYDPRSTEVITAYVHLENGGVTEDGVQDGRSLDQVLYDLRTLIGGEGQLATAVSSITDPMQRKGYVKVLDVREEELRYKGEAAPLLSAVVVMRKVDA